MKYLVILFILSAFPAAGLAAPNADAAFKAKPWKTWTDKTNTLWSVSGPVRTIATKENAVRFNFTAKDSLDVPIVAIVDDATGNEWVGKKTDLYVETSSGIVGVSLPYSGMLIWDTGVMAATHSKETVDDLSQRFEKEANLKRLIEVYDPVTDLRPILHPSFFGNDPNVATDAGARITHRELIGSELELDLENRSRTHTAKVWINLTNRTVAKAIQDGEQIVLN